MNVLFVGGKFNSDGGTSSKCANMIFSGCLSELIRTDTKVNNVKTFNGGSLDDLQQASLCACDANIVLWFADVLNGIDKGYVKSIKSTNPTCILVASKSKVNRTYTFPSLIQKMLSLKANLFVEFDRAGWGYKASLFDPLGNEWLSEESEMEFVGIAIAARVATLIKLTRMRSQHEPVMAGMEVPNEDEFFKFVRESAIDFAKLIPSPTEVTRFVGNASFRCSHGFPSFADKRGIVWVSCRNVDKGGINGSQFIPVRLHGDMLLHGGNMDVKPSVDAPMQCKLYQMFPNIKYMIHGHVYLDNINETTESLPCGVLEEASLIFLQVKDIATNFFMVNLKGHGFIAGSNSVKKLNECLPQLYMARVFPESQ